MKRKLFLVFFWVLLCSKKGFSYPDCSSIISFEEYQIKSALEKKEIINPYLLSAFCETEREEYYINLYFRGFKSQQDIRRLLEELYNTSHRANINKNSTDFFDFLDRVLDQAKVHFKIKSDNLSYTVTKYNYLLYRNGFNDACHYLTNEVEVNINNLPGEIDAFFYLINSSKCAENADDFNKSIFYLMKALELSKKLPAPQNTTRKGHVYKFLSRRYYSLKDYEKALYYANQCINTFLPEFENNIGTGVGYEFKGLSTYRLTKNIEEALTYFEKAQHIYTTRNNISRFHFVEKLKAELFLETEPDLALVHIFKFLDYFETNNRRVHFTPGWLFVHQVMKKHKLKIVKASKNRLITHKQVIEKLTDYLDDEELKNQLLISGALINYYSNSNQNDSLIKYNQLQNKLEAERNQISLQNKQTNVDLYLKNYEKEQNIASLNLQKQKTTYENRLLFFFICFVLTGSIFYYFYKRKQRQMTLAKLRLKEVEHNKLKMEKQLNDEQILRQKQDERILKLAYDNEVKRKKLLQLRLNQKQSEVESAKLEKQSSVKLLNEVFETLKNENIKDAGHLIKKLQANHVITKQNNSLKELFESISPVFMSKLNKLNLNLTEQDILYCILIRQKYSTKQIANFLNIIPKSVNQHKYRLKRKLNIPKDKDINNFIQNL
jgi:DNA-binding CsgD family transcriptional regulator